MTATPGAILEKLAEAEQAAVNMESPKAVITFLLTQREKSSILYFYKPNSIEFDFEKFHAAVKEMRQHKSR